MKIFFMMMFFIRLFFSTSDKNPSNPSSCDYELPIKVYTGSLTGEELLFLTAEGWTCLSGVFLSDVDVGSVHQLALSGPYGMAVSTCREDCRVAGDRKREV